MELIDKIAILTDAAKYDVSCSSSGSDRKNHKKGLGNGHMAGICHSWSEDGRCISLLKILFTNYCIYNCKYCVNARENDVVRACFTVEEIVELTMNFYRRNYIEGLFLSSGIIQNADYTMEKLIAVAKTLRLERGFHGYIHMKAIPGADERLIEELGHWVDRMSINIELPTGKTLALLAPDKNYTHILPAMEKVAQTISCRGEERKKFKATPSFVPAGQTTQMIIGAAREDDLMILSRAQKLYDDYVMKRVYYSAYVPVSNSDLLQHVKAAPLLREHRIYQADFLMRFYGFRAEDILEQSNPYFDEEVDPKMNWAIEHYQKPLEINCATKEELLRIPGIGPRGVQKIIQARRFHPLCYDDLKKLHISTKRAMHFITVRGEYRGLSFDSKEALRDAVKEKPAAKQMSMWEMKV